MTNEQKELLKNAGILEEDFEKCYITEDNIIFTPNGEQTGEGMYNKWLEDKNKEPIKEISQEEYLVDLDYRLSKIEMGV